MFIVCHIIACLQIKFSDHGLGMTVLGLCLLASVLLALRCCLVFLNRWQFNIVAVECCC